MHGLGNDYIYVNTMTESVVNPSKLAELLSDRHFGVGADGLILITPSGRADAGMDIYNADGSRAMMCGNGIRCVAKYVYDRGIVRKNKIAIETLSGIKETEILAEHGGETQVKVNMGKPWIKSRKLGITVGRKHLSVDYISMGNPHAVVWTENPAGLGIEHTGPAVEYHPAFGERVNVEFARVADRTAIELRVWERGAGETSACGTGACAAAVSAVLNDLTEREVEIKLIGGNLLVEWCEESGNVYMTGPAVTVFDGELKK